MLVNVVKDSIIRHKIDFLDWVNIGFVNIFCRQRVWLMLQALWLDSVMLHCCVDFLSLKAKLYRHHGSSCCKVSRSVSVGYEDPTRGFVSLYLLSGGEDGDEDVLWTGVWATSSRKEMLLDGNIQHPHPLVIEATDTPSRHPLPPHRPLSHRTSQYHYQH